MMRFLPLLLFAASAAADKYQYISLVQFQNTSTEAQQKAAIEGLQKALATNPTAGKNIKASRGTSVEKDSAQLATLGVYDTLDAFKAYFDSPERKEASKPIDAIAEARLRVVFTSPDVKAEAPATGKFRRSCGYYLTSNTTAADVKSIIEAFKATAKKFPKITYFVVGENVFGDSGPPKSGLGMVQDWADEAGFKEYYNSTDRAEFSKKYITPHAEVRKCATFFTTSSGTRKYLRYD